MESKTLWKTRWNLNEASEEESVGNNGMDLINKCAVVSMDGESDNESESVATVQFCSICNTAAWLIDVKLDFEIRRAMKKLLMEANRKNIMKIMKKRNDEKYRSVEYRNSKAMKKLLMEANRKNILKIMEEEKLRVERRIGEKLKNLKETN